jgi:hypothetical protein
LANGNGGLFLVRQNALEVCFHQSVARQQVVDVAVEKTEFPDRLE